MSKLETEMLGMTFPNPFILSAGPPTAKGSMVIKAFKAGWGGAVLKTIGLEPTPHTSVPHTSAKAPFLPGEYPGCLSNDDT